MNKDDYVKVVRCEQCAVPNEPAVVNGFIKCRFDGKIHSPEHFCSYGNDINNNI
jgi:hypothetical protein